MLRRKCLIDWEGKLVASEQLLIRHEGLNMKVVLFCGGLGMRLREYSESIPKPMVPIGYRPIMWHVMKYYAHFGHKDFILCLGHGADVVKRYFLQYDECQSNDFVLSQGGKHINLINSDIQDWSITFADTGVTSNIGQRLKAVEKYLDGEDVFLANYSDGLTDLHLPAQIEHFRAHGKIASCICITPPLSYHIISMGKDDHVEKIQGMSRANMKVNGGYFIFKKEIFSYIEPGEELVVEPFQRLIKERQLLAYEHAGYWECMDTFKDKQRLDEMYARGEAPWELWKPRSEKKGTF